MTWENGFISLLLVLKKWNLASLMEERMVNTLVLILWKCLS